MTYESQMVRTRVNLQSLDLRLRALAWDFIGQIEQRFGQRALVHQGVRTFEEQDALYAQGRTQPGSIVTNARGGESYHNYRLAFDYCWLNPDGSPNWEVPWEECGAVARSMGLDAGVFWLNPDRPHVGLKVASIAVLKQVAPYGIIPPDWVAPEMS